MSFLKEHKNEVILFTGSVVASYGTRMLVRLVWKAIHGRYPREKPEEDGVTTAQALSWTVSLAIAGGLAKILFRKSATKRMLGS